MSTKRPRLSGCVISIMAQTRIQRPRHSPFGEASTCSTLPSKDPINGFRVNSVHATEWEIVDLYPEGGGVKPGIVHGLRLTRFIKANQVFIKGPRSLRDMIFIALASSEKRMSTVLEVIEVTNLKILCRPPHALQGA